MPAGSVRDEVLDTEHAVVTRTYIEQWARRDRPDEKVLIVVVPRVDCPEHRKITAAVPWARHDDRFTIPFEDHSAWLAAQMPWTKAARELRVTWEALANIVARVAGDAADRLDRLAGLPMTGIDEKSWGNGGGKYLTVVTDHGTGKIAWARWIHERRDAGAAEETGEPDHRAAHRAGRNRRRRQAPCARAS